MAAIKSDNAQAEFNKRVTRIKERMSSGEKIEFDYDSVFDYAMGRLRKKEKILHSEIDDSCDRKHYNNDQFIKLLSNEISIHNFTSSLLDHAYKYPNHTNFDSLDSRIKNFSFIEEHDSIAHLFGGSYSLITFAGHAKMIESFMNDNELSARAKKGLRAEYERLEEGFEQLYKKYIDIANKLDHLAPKYVEIAHEFNCLHHHVCKTLPDEL
jgi:hypothetical protein